LIGNNDNESGLFDIDFLIYNLTDPIYGPQFDLVHINCPAGQRANASFENDLLTWRYRWFRDFPDLRLTQTADSGAWHGEEITVIWDTIPETPGVPTTDAERKVQKYVQGAWIALPRIQ
jgi:carboxylesterase type B